LQLWTKLKSTIPCQRRFQGFEYLLNPQLLSIKMAEIRILTLLCQFCLTIFQKGYPLTYVSDVMGLGSLRKSTINLARVAIRIRASP
jgi:hypothetical protein